MRVYLEADAPRVSCVEHGVTVSVVGWARHGSRFTIGFDDTAAWLAAHVVLSTPAILLRVTWRSVAGIVVRVVAEPAGRTDPQAVGPDRVTVLRLTPPQRSWLTS